MSRFSRGLLGALLFIFAMVLWPTQASAWAQLPITLSGPPTVHAVEPIVSSGPFAKLPTEIPTGWPQPTLTATSTPTLRPSPTASPTPTTAPTLMTAIGAEAATPIILPAVNRSENLDPPAHTVDPAWPLIVQALKSSGFVLGLAVLGFFIGSGLRRVAQAITTEMRTVSLATLRLRHEAEWIERREKVVFGADSDVLSLLEQAILDATGESVRVCLLPHGWLASPPMMAVVDADQTRYIFSPTPPAQVQAIARRQGLAQLLLGQATDLTAYPIDALTSTPFIADDLSGAYGYVLARHQAPRRPLPRTDRWYLYLARPKTSRWPRWLDRQVKQTGTLKRFTDRLHGPPDSKPSSSTADRNSKSGD